MNLKSKHHFISIVDDQALHFMEVNSRDEIAAVESISLKSLRIDDVPVDTLPASIKPRGHTLMIVPDYWFGNASHRFQSRKKAWADAFINRKLQEQFPDLPEIRHFFDGNFYQRERAEKWIYAYFLSAPQFFKVYQCLVHWNLQPHRITCPAFIWQQKLKRAIPDFDKGAKGLVQLRPGIGLLYFFFEGNFLFSRHIPLSAEPSQPSENFNAITYELNQSLYLFSQKTKAEIDQLYLMSAEKENGQGLSEVLGRHLNDVNDLINASPTALKLGAAAGALGFLSPRDLVPGSDFLALSHRVLKKERAWRPVQFAGIAIGLILFLLLGLESILLGLWSRQILRPIPNQAGTAATEGQPDIQPYNEALDVLLTKLEKPSPQEVLAKLAKSLPPNIRMSEISVELENNAFVDFKGVIRTQGLEQFKRCLSLLITHLNQNMHGRRLMAVPDIDFELDQTQLDLEVQNYLIKFRLDL